MEEEQEEENGSPEIETLPLFPMHGEDIHGYCNLKSNSSNYGAPSWYQAEDGFINASRTTSLELSLNSYTRRSPDYAWMINKSLIHVQLVNFKKKVNLYFLSIYLSYIYI